MEGRVCTGRQVVQVGNFHPEQCEAQDELCERY